ncbi:MAG: DUF4349 domain-containing protein [Chloroflexi bacterium]|nr:DUF4349 domain-containing protein [Chloroflexota bacterium]
MHNSFKPQFPNMKSILILILVISLMILSGCASAKSPQNFVEESAKQEAIAPALPMEKPATGMEMDASYTTSDISSPERDVKRIVIKNVNLSIVVDDPAKTMDEISLLAEELKGFVVSANLNKYTLENNIEVPHATITIRVPAEKLTEAIEAIEKKSNQEPINKSIDSQDVTSEYTDLQSRLRNLESAEEQLRKIMDDAVRTEDVLSVYNQLVNIREQIEVVKGQIKYYDEASSLSAISVDILANEAVQPLTIGGWQPVGVAKDAVQALINMMKVIVNIVIWLIIFVLPVVLIFVVVFVLPIRWLIRLWKRSRTNKKARETSVLSPSEPPSGDASSTHS